jgi:hypothetical protein
VIAQETKNSIASSAPSDCRIYTFSGEKTPLIFGLINQLRTKNKTYAKDNAFPLV